MTETSKNELQTAVLELAKKAKMAGQQLLAATSEQRRLALHAIADGLGANKAEIILENQLDIAAGQANGLSDALLDRLTLDEKRINAMMSGVRQVADLPDPIGNISELQTQRRGFKVGKMRTPIGVIGIIYESRPNVTVDAAAICLKSGNSVVLRGGSEALHSNLKLVQIIQTALAKTAISPQTVAFVNSKDRMAVDYMLTAKGLIDVIIPRGGKNLVKVVSEKAKVPVIKHLDGICHVYIDEFADNTMAKNIAVNAKTYRYGICGSMETLLIHKDKVLEVLPDLITLFKQKQVELVVCEKIHAKFTELDLATNIDWETEYLAAKLSIKQVNDIDEAIEHINTFGSHHTDSIVSLHSDRQQRFLSLVDSASVMVNTPTCFADGFEYGLGAEIGISTDKLHVRGPVGIVGLTTEKYIVIGHGELRD